MAGSQLFLDAVRKIVQAIGPDALDEAAFGPWRYASALPVLGWDLVAGERDYALRATNPSGDKKRGVPGADWLAFRALAYFPVVLRDGAATTTGFEGGGKRYWFHWSLWSPPVSAAVARSLVAQRWDRRPASARAPYGVVLSLRSFVRRTDQGGYGSFSAASVE